MNPYGTALEGVRVLDLDRGVSASYCARLLADHGADVVKIERPREGDPARRMGPFPEDVPHLEKSGLYLHLNMSKRGVTLEVGATGAAAILVELVREADVLPENFRPTFLPSHGLGYDELHEVNPRLVMASILLSGRLDPTGTTRPWRWGSSR